MCVFCVCVFFLLLFFCFVFFFHFPRSAEEIPVMCNTSDVYYIGKYGSAMKTF